MNFFADVHLIATSLASIAASLSRVASAMTGGPVGIEISPGTPTIRPHKEMAMKVTLSKGKQSAQCKHAKAGDGPVDFLINDNQDDTATVYGTNSAGDRIDISAAATLTVASSDPSVLSVDAPSGVTFAMHALAVGHADVTVTATWNDGSVGPFTFVLPVDVRAGGPTGLIVVPGTPTVRS